VTPLSIRSASEVYTDAARCEIVRHWVDHAGLGEMSRSLRTLVESLGDEATDEFWRRILGPLRRTAFALCSTPLPFALAGSVIGPDWNQLQRLTRQSQQMFPDSHDLLNSIVIGLQRLLLEPGSPLIEPLEILRQKQGEFSIILRNPRMNKEVANFLARSKTLRDLKVVSASQLRGSSHCSVLVAIGPCGWFPEYVFSAPRAAAVHVVSYRWIRDAWKPGPLFLHNTGAANKSSSHSIGPMPRINGGIAPHGSHCSAAEDLHPPDLLPPIPVFRPGGFPYGSSTAEATDELIPARLCHVSGGRAVLVAADDDASCLIIDTSEIGHAAVRRMRVDALEQGLCLLLRTSGGGDFIAPLADRILGALAVKRRSEQVEWKNRLIHTAIARFGVVGRRELSARVCADLQAQGLSQARKTNVHYWMSSKCIRPQQTDDFAAIMNFAGLAARTQEIWSAMGDIDRAHRQAGHLIRRMLMQKIGETSLETLERDGEMDFELGDQEGGSISAYQITDIATQEYEVPADRIGVLLDLEG
jgi:hypothetical protein